MTSRLPLEPVPGTNADGDRERRFRAVIVAATVLLVLTILAILVFSFLQRRQEILSTAEQTAQNLVQVIEEQTKGSIVAVEVALTATARTMQQLPARSATRQADIHDLLLENVRKLPFLRAIWILDATGEMMHDSESLPGRHNLSDREYFRVHRGNPSYGLYVEGPILSQHGVWFIGISRRIDNPDGSFGGVIVAALEPRYLQRFYESINVGKEGVVALMQPDGTLMVRAPATQNKIGQKLSPVPAFVGMLAYAASGTYRAASPVDGVARIYTYRRVEGEPLVVLVGLGEKESLAAWWALARIYVLASLAFILLIFWLGYLVLRELHRRSALVLRLHELSRRLLAVEETERRNINHELHDRVGQNLSTLNLNLNLTRSQLSQSTLSALEGSIEDAQKLLESTIAQVRNVMAELHPPALDDFGLLAALRTYSESFSARVGTPISVFGEDFAPRLSPEVEISFFRIAQEALANAAKHAHAKFIGVTLTNTPERVTLTIADDGAGFDTGRPSATSWGLTIMRERAGAVGITVRIESAAGRGTRVVANAMRKTA